MSPNSHQGHASTLAPPTVSHMTLVDYNASSLSHVEGPRPAAPSDTPSLIRPILDLAASLWFPQPCKHMARPHQPTKPHPLNNVPQSLPRSNLLILIGDSTSAAIKASSSLNGF